MGIKEKRIQQMKEKGYFDLTPEQRVERLRKSFYALDELFENVNEKALNYATEERNKES